MFQDGKVLPNQVRELTASCAALCLSRSLRDVLQYVVPLTQSTILLQEVNQPENRMYARPDVPTKSATVPRSTRTQKPPPIPPRAGSRDRKVFYTHFKNGYLKLNNNFTNNNFFTAIRNTIRAKRELCRLAST